MKSYLIIAGFALILTRDFVAGLCLVYAGCSE